ncbi:MAG TPA: RNA-splicing ligase RtcB, partial [Planctomycetaceae bacterium]|nr:RNA-splicing ligase RtcB [Planctomycetaceae bacterium]
MNRRQLQKLGVPEDCVKSAIAAIHSIRREQSGGKKEVKQLLQAVLVAPEDYLEDPHVGAFAQAVITDREFVRPEPIAYRTWGSEI